MNRVVLDSNIVLLDANNILTLGENRIIVLPETVLEECDNKKSGFGELAYQARTMGRILASADVVDIVKTDRATTTTLSIGKVTIEVVALDEYIGLIEDDSGRNDQKIIQVAKAVADKYQNTVFMSNDVMARLRALATGLEVIDLKLIDDAEFEFVKELDVEDSEVFRTLRSSNIYDVDPEYVLENCSYKFSNTNTGQMKLATVQNGFIKILGAETENSLRAQDCAPINSEQLLASQAIQDTSIDLVLIEGQAGSGKNIVALSNAIKLMKRHRDKYTSIVYLRTPQNDEDLGEDIGYVSGNEEKYAIYLGPMEDTVDFIVRHNTKPKAGDKKGDLELRVQEGIEALRAECKMESMITTGLRGRTFHNTIVIMDEWQNASQGTSQKVLTRIGKDCKVIVTGSQRQIDSKYVSKFNNGLAVLMGEVRDRSITTDVNLFAIELKKVVRSPMAKFAEDLFSKK